MAYPGGKGGIYRRLINLMPPHEVYIETHLGGGAVMENKRPAKQNIGIDIDPAVIEQYRASPKEAGRDQKDLKLIQGDAVKFLEGYKFTGNELVYCDPPYLRKTRKGGQLYEHEYTITQHKKLLKIIFSLPCMVMISGYESDLYKTKLKGWNSVSFQAATRQGTAIEWLWMNYPTPAELHDYTYLGDNFREREVIKRKKKRWVARLEKMKVLERQTLFLAMQEVCKPPDNTGKNSDMRSKHLKKTKLNG